MPGDAQWSWRWINSVPLTNEFGQVQVKCSRKKLTPPSAVARRATPRRAPRNGIWAVDRRSLFFRSTVSSSFFASSSSSSIRPLDSHRTVLIDIIHGYSFSERKEWRKLGWIACSAMVTSPSRLKRSRKRSCDYAARLGSVRDSCKTRKSKQFSWILTSLE